MPPLLHFEQWIDVSGQITVGELASIECAAIANDAAVPFR
jgi:hypothetical protein